MNAYNEMYLQDAMQNLGEMMEYIAVACSMDMNTFFDRFIISGYAYAWEHGDPACISGMSGTELGRRVLESTEDSTGVYPPALIMYDAGEEYWCGWIMAYIQWRLNIPFRRIKKIIDFDGLTRIYPAMHTAPEERCVNHVLELMKMERSERNNISRLQFYRQQLGLTQKELAEAAEVNLRTLQQYETGSKDIARASVSSVIRLARVLEHSPEELIFQ